MENNNNNQMVHLDEAIKWFANYKHYFYLTDDDIQDCLIKFHKYYDPTKSKVGSFCKLLVQQLKVTQLRNKNLIKNDGITFSLDSSFDDEDDDGYTNYLHSIGSYEMDIEMDTELHNENNKRMVKEYLTYLTAKQREVFQLHFFDELTILEVAEMKGISRQAIECLITNGIKRIKNKLK